MSLNPVLWPHTVLKPAQILANPVPFTRTGGRSLGGLSRTTRTDRGWWSITYKGVTLMNADRRRLWNALRQQFGGMAGSLAIPVWSYDTAEWLAGASDGMMLTTHSDGTLHSDGTGYAQPVPIIVQMVTAAAISATSVTLRLVYGIEDLSGVRFSYNHALYETGLPTSIDGDQWTLPVFPAIRAPIPAGAELNFAMPTCLVKLANDRAMDVVLSAGRVDQVDVEFMEDVAYWSDAATA